MNPPSTPGSRFAAGARSPVSTDFTREEAVRYARHLVLPEVGAEGQARLREARVLCVGAGGLGSPLALYLAAAGVGTLGVVDFDEVDLTNLQRQILHGTGDVGRPKVDSARDRLREVNPRVEVVPHRARLTRENALGILDGYDVVADGTDNFPTRYLVNDACVLLGIPNVYASVLRWEGQLSVFATRGGPCYRCLFREPPDPGLVQSCAEGGVLGVLPGIMGSLQALETVKWILGAGESMVGRLLLVDGLSMAFREVELRRDPACPVCGDEPTQSGLIDYEVFCGVEGAGAAAGGEAAPGAGPAGVPEVTARELSRRLRGPRPPLVLDVREPWEWTVGNLEGAGARLVPLRELRDRLDELPSHRSVVAVCRSGGRSAEAVRILHDAGWDEAANLRGGLQAWARDVDPDLEVG